MVQHTKRRASTGTSSKSTVYLIEVDGEGIDRHVNQVEKHYKQLSDFDHEMAFLTLLSGQYHFPTVVGADPTTLVITLKFAGVLLTQENCPLDYKEQLHEIVSTLWQTSTGIFHNDIWKNNLLVDTAGKITLIDFEHASFSSQSSPYMNLTPAAIDRAASLENLLESIWAKRDQNPIATLAEESLDHPRRPEVHTILVWDAHKDADAAEQYIQTHMQPPAFTVLYNKRLPLDPALQRSLCNTIYGIEADNRVMNGSVHLFVVRDEVPVYQWANATSCRQVLNVNLKKHKEALRTLLGGSVQAYHCVHASYNSHEARQVLTPLNLDHLASHRPTFKTFGELFACLNTDPHLQYVVQRSFHELSNDPHWFLNQNDVDVLVSDYYHFKALTGAQCSICQRQMRDTDNGHLIQNQILIAGVAVSFDVRFVGDNYVDTNWESDMLQRSVQHVVPGTDCTIQIPCPEDEFYSLLYHVLVQKPTPHQSKHRPRLKALLAVLEGSDGTPVAVLPDVPELWCMLRRFVFSRGYLFRKPNDHGVGFRIGSK